MRNHFVAFWVWNRRKSPMTMTPPRVASGKAPFSRRVLQSLCGTPLYRKLEKKIAKSKREKREAAPWLGKFGKLPQP
jgi:hypothetical protein